ncbi:Crp/Fnr family transcriptional regulator [Aquimarina aquimarini]|uniref:Crp/Fnr family transcriptional regulator n=1 Tax=Aquimarina aquimarini TaxID=1191734 RepID=UPI000D554311|nr:Crp/Fnr family transcriptional regulator [Aquimarina aquimarini]
MITDKEACIVELKSKFESYASIEQESWLLMRSIISFQTLKREEVLLRHGEVAKNFYYVCRGALRAYFTNSDGDTYNKNIFLENDFAGSTVSYLQKTPSAFTLEALEDSVLIAINYKKYRDLITKKEDLKNFYIAYLEKNWVIEKEQREISLVMENATQRYLQLLQEYPNIDQRIPQLHIASHIGVTPTQLSRIRKEIKKNS